MSDHKSNGSIIPFLLGLLCGAVLGVLLAPEKGEVTRKKLKKKTDELKGQLRPSIESIKEKAGPVVETLSKRAAPIVSGFKKIEELENEVREEFDETFEGEETLPIDTTLTAHKIDLPESVSPSTTVRPKKKSLFKNIK